MWPPVSRWMPHWPAFPAVGRFWAGESICGLLAVSVRRENIDVEGNNSNSRVVAHVLSVKGPGRRVGSPGQGTRRQILIHRRRDVATHKQQCTAAGERSRSRTDERCYPEPRYELLGGPLQQEHEPQQGGCNQTSDASHGAVEPRRGPHMINVNGSDYGRSQRRYANAHPDSHQKGGRQDVAPIIDPVNTDACVQRKPRRGDRRADRQGQFPADAFGQPAHQWRAEAD